MNERIKELAEQAGAYRIYDLDRPNDGPLLRLKHLGIEKFAELIVKECADRIDDLVTCDDDGNQILGCDDVRTELLEHFGVEE